MATPLLDVQHLTVIHPSPSGPVQAVRDISLQIFPGETMALVGETGCGKSSLALALVGLLDRRSRMESGGMLFVGRDLSKLQEKEWRSVRGRAIGFIFQDARSALNPVLTVGEHLSETLRAHQLLSRPKARETAVKLLHEVGIPDPARIVRCHPLELSGGMCQRIAIALAICNHPRLLIADEPTSALDPTLQTQVLDLLREMKRRHDLSLLLISHDLALLPDFADRVAVMYCGRLVEYGPAVRILSGPVHPYARGLLQSQPGLNHHRDFEPLAPIPGSLPSPATILPGCSFAPRCAIAEPRCKTKVPAAAWISEDHWVACIKAGSAG